MELLSRLGASWTTLAAILISTVTVYATVILLTRITGPRALAKMSSYDFAATVAIGSTVASTALASTPLANGVLVLALLYGLQRTISALRRRGFFGGAIDNRPLLLMAGPDVLPDALTQASVSREEVMAQLRQAGVHRLEQVHAVVLETTGSMSVLTQDQPLSPELLDGVRGVERLREASQRASDS